MSLQIWLPLVKDLRNQGLSNITITNNGATYSATDGKLGGCYIFANNYIQTNYNFYPGTGDFSISCWFYLTENTSKTYQHICSFKTTAATSAGIAMIYNRSQQKFLWSTANGSTAQEIWSADTFPTSSIYNTWHHLIMVRDQNDAKHGYFYLDGVRKELASVPTILNITTNANTLKIGSCGETYSSYYWTGKLNDFRLYNHCISAQEAKQLSQGLVIHYLLNGDSLTSLGYQRLEYLQSTGTQCIDTGIVPQNTYTYKFKYSIDTISGYLGPFGSYSAESANSTRVIIRNGSTTDLLIFFDCKAGGGGITISSITTAAGQVVEGHLSKTSYSLKNLTTGTTKSNSDSTDLFTNKGTALTEHMTLFSYSSTAYMEGKIYYFDTCIGDTYIQRLVPVKRISDNVLGMFDLISGTFFTNIGSGTFTAGPVITESTIEYDGSGYQYNGTRYGTFTWSSDTPNLYNVSTYFNDYTSYIKAPMEGWTPTEMTLSCWVKSSNKSPRGNWHIPLNLDGQKAEISINRNGQITTGFIIAGTRRTGNFGSVDILNGQWHMLTVTFDGTNIKSYIDANLIETRNYAGALSSMNYVYCGIFGGDNSFANTQLYQSDVRVYATALSAKDITSLYQNSAYIDDNNVIYGQIR